VRLTLGFHVNVVYDITGLTQRVALSSWCRHIQTRARVILSTGLEKLLH